MHVLAVVPFLNEEAFLPTFLRSMERQTRPPDRLMLVDDGSTDRSAGIAAAFAAEHRYATSVVLPTRARQGDRLATASELRAFHRGLAEAGEPWDVVVKMDADLELTPVHFETVIDALQGDSTLGVCGAYLSCRDERGNPVREKFRSEHVHGPNKFYRRDCYEQISPLPEILGWDGIDEVTARAHGWNTRSIELPGGDSIHLRPTGMQQGALRANRRWGWCAYAAGAYPLFAAASGAARCLRPPYVLGGLHYVVGYVLAAIRRAPRANIAVREQIRAEERRRAVEALMRLVPSRAAR